MGQENKFQKLYDSERVKIDEKLHNALEGRKPESLYKPASYILDSKGKRLRPILVLFAARAAGGSFDKAYNAALAVEMLHNFTLVHDDIMDNSDKRRGRPTLHKQYDVSTAILVGDGLLSVAYEYLLQDITVNPVETIQSFTTGLIEVCEGQSLDKDFETLEEVSIDDYIIMIQKKTAAMAEMCCRIGSLIAGGEKQITDALGEYGKSVGFAFQIQDDLLDISGDETKIGKRIGGDLIEGKKTFLFLNALEKAEGKTRQKLIEAVKNNGIDPAEVDLYRKFYDELGVIDEAKKEIEKYTAKALKQLVLLKEEDREIFTWLANMLLKRNK